MLLRAFLGAEGSSWKLCSLRRLLPGWAESVLVRAFLTADGSLKKLMLAGRGESEQFLVEASLRSAAAAAGPCRLLKGKGKGCKGGPQLVASSSNGDGVLSPCPLKQAAARAAESAVLKPWMHT